MQHRMTLSKYESTRGTTNLARIARVILSPCRDILQNVLEQQIIPTDFRKKFQKFREKLHKKWHVFIREGELVPDESENYTKFNISMLYLSLRCICAIKPHENKWGNFPGEKDRSLSANIERLYSLQKKYNHFPDDFLNDLTFEHEWKNIFQIVKELEEYLATGADYQDTLNKLKICAMEPDVEKVFIEKLRGKSN